MESGKQRLTKILTLSGLALFSVGIVIWFIMIGGRVASRGDLSMLTYSWVPVGICSVGAILALSGLYSGFKTARAWDSDEPVIDSKNATIVSCTMMDKRGELVAEPQLYDPERLLYYVQVQFADGSEHELRTVSEIFAGIVEGQRGVVSYQGKWLGKFVPNRPSS